MPTDPRRGDGGPVNSTPTPKEHHTMSTTLDLLPGYVRAAGVQPVLDPGPDRLDRLRSVHRRPPAAIEVAHLEVRRGGRTVLDDLSFTVARGSITGLLGPSGCGKSTLIRSVMGVQRTSGGQVTVLGLPAGSPVLRSRVGYVTQAPALYDDLTVEENLRYFARLIGATDDRVDDVLSIVDLESARRRGARALSGGQRARVSLAAALLGRPRLLVLDEPTVGLDPVLRRSLWQTFEGLAETGTTLLVSSHVMDEAARCHEVLLMRDGALLAAESPDRLRARTGAPDLEEAFLRLAGEVA
jgi:ABC-2 type transport system ATP-binding protein